MWMWLRRRIGWPKRYTSNIDTSALTDTDTDTERDTMGCVCLETKQENIDI